MLVAVNLRHVCRTLFVPSKALMGSLVLAQAMKERRRDVRERERQHTAHCCLGPELEESAWPRPKIVRA